MIQEGLSRVEDQTDSPGEFSLFGWLERKESWKDTRKGQSFSLMLSLFLLSKPQLSRKKFRVEVNGWYVPKELEKFERREYKNFTLLNPITILIYSIPIKNVSLLRVI